MIVRVRENVRFMSEARLSSSKTALEMRGVLVEDPTESEYRRNGTVRRKPRRGHVALPAQRIGTAV